MAKLTELEGVVLGLVHRLQPCTAYAVRMALSRSPSTYWSGSSGSVYPALKRLENTRLLESTADASDGRSRRLIGLTRAGRAALETWVMGASDPEVVSCVFDPVRARAFFLEILRPRDRARFASECLSALEKYMEVTRAELAATEDERPLESLANLGAVRDARARVDWMGEVVDKLESDLRARD